MLTPVETQRLLLRGGTALAVFFVVAVPVLHRGAPTPLRREHPWL